MVSANTGLIGAFGAAAIALGAVALIDRTPKPLPELVADTVVTDTQLLDSQGKTAEAAAADISGATIRSYLLQNPEVVREALMLLEQKRALEEAQADEAMVSANAAAIFEDGFSHIGGNPEGSVTIVEFQDYRCGYCKRAHGEVKDLIEADGDIRIIYKEFPILGPDSLRSSQLAIAAKIIGGDAAYNRLNDLLMSYGGPLNDAALGKIAAQADLDFAALDETSKSDEVATRIETTHALGRTLEVSGTPTFIIGGKMVRGYIPQAEMARMVDLVRDETK